jgi:hypothetical protein
LTEFKNYEAVFGKLEGEKPAIRNAPASAELKEFVEGLAKRAGAL